MPEETKTTEVNVIPLAKYTEKAMCDFGHKFYSNSVKLIPFKNVTTASLGELMYVDENNLTRLSTDSAPESGYLLACPVCGVIHIEGFSIISDNEEALHIDNTIPERNINLSL